jgi:hypothetical protein
MVRLSLWDTADGGTELWNEEKEIIIKKKQLITTLGDTVGLDTIDFSEQLWVQVESIDRHGSSTVLGTREPLRAVPYALYSPGVPGAGDVTAVIAGSGLSGGGEFGDVTLSADTTYVQRRVSGTCTAGSSIRAINTDGTVTCEQDTVGWGLTGNAGTDPTMNFIGTTDNQEVRFRVNNTEAFCIVPDANSPNIIGGCSANRITSGVSGATISGGGRSMTYASRNRVTDSYGTIGGGSGNVAGNDDIDTGNASGATIAGGSSNIASGGDATIGGGWQNEASAWYSTIAGGWNNTASGSGAFVGAGMHNRAEGEGSAVAGGQTNTAAGRYSTVAGGESSTAYGDFSFAAGRSAKANAAGCFVWADSLPLRQQCDIENRFVARTTGGAIFITNAPLVSGVQIGPGENAWSSASDRNMKENFSIVDSKEVLERLAAIPITAWSYKSEDPTIRHIGPVAQDFYGAFGLGKSERYISTIDADGVALAAIQGLHKVVQEKEAEIRTLRQENRELSQRMRRIEQRLATIEIPVATHAQK